MKNQTVERLSKKLGLYYMIKKDNIGNVTHGVFTCKVEETDFYNSSNLVVLFENSESLIFYLMGFERALNLFNIK